MSIISRVMRAAVLSIAVIALITAGFAFDSTDDTIHKSFTVEQGGTLNVDTDNGSIEVQGTNGRTVDIEVLRKVRTTNENRAQQILENFKISFEKRGRDVYITGERLNKDRFWDNLWNRLSIKYIIHVPEIYNVELRTSGGSISVEVVEGEVNVKTSGGSLSLDDITGPVWGKTSGGSIRVGSVDGNVDVNTSGGSIKIVRALGTVKAHTSGGGITVEEVMGTIDAHTSGGSVKAHISQQPDSDCRLSTSGGSVTVYLASDISVDLDASTSGGSVYTDFPVTIRGKLNPRKLNAKINGGGPLLYLHTSGGSIHVKEF